MRGVPKTTKARLAIVMLLAITSLALPALFGHVPIGGYDRGGYEYSGLRAGYGQFGGYDRGGYEFS